MNALARESGPGHWSIRSYRLLMRAYPQDFIAAYGESVDQAFRDMVRDALQQHGRLGLVLLWFHVIPDFLFSAVELLTTKANDFLKWNLRWRWTLACALGFTLGTAAMYMLIPLGLPRELDGMPVWLILGYLQARVLTRKRCDPMSWILLSVLGAVLGRIVLEPLIPRPPFTFFDSRISGWFVLLQYAYKGPAAILGASIGLAQWVILRRQHVNPLYWVAACSAGLFARWFIDPAGFAVADVLVKHTILGEFGAVAIVRVVPALAGGIAFGLITAGPLAQILHAQRPEQVPTPKGSSVHS